MGKLLKEHKIIFREMIASIIIICAAIFVSMLVKIMILPMPDFAEVQRIATNIVCEKNNIESVNDIVVARYYLQDIWSVFVFADTKEEQNQTMFSVKINPYTGKIISCE